ncbi:alpha/beta fold hydrolase [Urbifossiella limnaea]|uniref:Alpha/beta hydrolase family protein n=1 Tax=Urbifossiella limnaea TaxID=2528023 RepID=A0A517Y383_9BACT|nr:alpha/beta fold hydrolase [Urbifossiella limnaea]QDU24172.1 Alpha/beta hydrolase family protein [Urbifossiella limnaea]
MTEQAFCFGPDESLVGVTTDPLPDRVRPDAPVVLWLNSGVLHHVGPFGWYATLARRLAGRGIRSFRFDLAGLGDSAPRSDAQETLDRAIRDVAGAMDLLARERAARRFVLVGLCSGAMLAQHVAARDERVAGAAFIDGYGFRTPGYYLRHYGKRLLKWRSWVNAARRVVRPRPAPAGNAEDRRLLFDQYFFRFPPADRGRELFATAVARGTRFLYLYTGGVESYFNHPRQFSEMFGRLTPGGDQVEVGYMPAADHLYSLRDQRLAMFDRVENWVERVR